MIKVKRLNHKEFVINCDHIYLIEATPDTVILLNNGKKFVVEDSIDEIINKVIEFKARVNNLKIDYNDEEV